MPSRRSVLVGGAAMLSAQDVAHASSEIGPLRFGVIADPQYADAPPHAAMNRYYANSLVKLRDAFASLNRYDLRFVATLGDLIDRDWKSFDAVLPLYGTLRHRTITVLGNHDFQVGPDRLSAVPRRAGLDRAYYDFAVGRTRFVVLDGNEISLFAPPVGDPRWLLAADRLAELRTRGAANAKPWNGSLGDEQFAWLSGRLDAARAQGERIVVLNHYPVYPDNPHNMWDAQRVVDLLAGNDAVVAYFCGHNHTGNYGEAGGIHYVNFVGMVDTPNDNAYAVVELGDDVLEITGFGREPSRRLKLRSA